MKTQTGEVGLTREPTCPLNVCVCVLLGSISYLSLIHYPYIWLCALVFVDNVYVGVDGFIYDKPIKYDFSHE